ncbi:hypothetical protein J8F10_09445 [Gemmata sp. G18]|uniref:DNA-binding protein n=1 Tax=Gemmata palustris TaxID=2822762 RepID=A0ABS5BQB2_9BACT|nr:hypothetical protein [Gemmata palustris]MBP3955505.1 hypothetical protein [Gemmata palustris]
MARPATPMIEQPTSEEICSEGAMSIDDVAAFTTISKPEVERIIARGEIETFRYGRCTLIANCEAVRWLAELLDKSRAGIGAR